MGGFRALLSRTPGIPRWSVAAFGLRSGVRRTGFRLRLGTVRGDRRGSDRHAHLLSFRALEGTANKVWFHAGTSCGSRKGTSAISGEEEKGRTLLRAPYFF